METFAAFPVAGEEYPVSAPHEYLTLHEEVEIINRASGASGPFSPIEKNESRTPRGNLTGFGIEIRDPDFVAHEDHQTDGWRFVGQVSPSYLLIDNREVVALAHEIIEETPAHRPRKVFFDGKRFVYNTVFPGQSVEGPLGDDVTFGLQFRNSYNGSMRFQASLYAERLVCKNGMISKTHFGQHRFKHVKGNGGWREDVEQALEVVHSAPDHLGDFVERLYQLEQTPIDEKALMHLRREGRGLGELPKSRFTEVFDTLIDEVPLGHDNDRMSPDTIATGYDVLNAATNVLWHRDKSVTDLGYNQGVVDQLVAFADEHHN
jgi:hypothetical protein